MASFRSSNSLVQSLYAVVPRRSSSFGLHSSVVWSRLPTLFSLSLDSFSGASYNLQLHRPGPVKLLLCPFVLILSLLFHTGCSATYQCFFLSLPCSSVLASTFHRCTLYHMLS